ncbi:MULTISPECIES: response regulator [unclassified Oleiphilus]|uniref:response regulator n=2 Tax=Oleiphilus TaxID=141450 RepID=UPI0007C24E9B|nr:MULTISPECIES: response regulator [unclassified Oleiphilus]KZZ35879.1 hypothetical protein A3757_14700 [Oleiphilus sp. HI0117]KZZ39056.1 hypothetical protein A3756_09145 [Oleiphilus sp. HI0086]
MRLTNTLKQLKKAPLLKRICLYSFLFSILLSLGIVFTKGVYSYQMQVDSINECLDHLLSSNLDPISEAVWRANDQKVEAILIAMLDDCHLHISGKETRKYTLSYDDGRTITVGSIGASARIEQSVYPISYWKGGEAQAYWLGELAVVQSLDGVIEEVSREGLTSFLLYVLVVACCSLTSVLLGYQIVVRRLRQFMIDLKNQNVDESMKRLSSLEDTEVSELWLSILEYKQEMEERLYKSEARLTLSQKELEAARKNSETKSLFLAKMSHELRTPMNGLLGFTSLLLESKLEDEQREYAQTIQVSLESLLYVVNDVLDLSRIESGDLMITTIPFNLRGVLSGVTILLKNRAESKGLVFESRISPDIPQTLRGDPVRIRQVLMNLVANAIQHTEKGHVFINVDLLSQKNSRAAIRLSIEDSGSKPIQRLNKRVDVADIGFSSELREKRSLGLDICYQLVDLMGSTLLNESKEDDGSTYWFELNLPVVRGDNSRELLDLSLLKTLKVLVIDSYELSRKITLELLSEWGIQFEAVGTAAEAIKALHSYAGSEEQFNMILCDDILQDLSGVEACQMIRQSIVDPVQIVVLCSNPQLGDAEGFFLAGASGFLSKQFRDPFLRGVMCQAYAERFRQGSERRLVTRYTVSDAEESSDPEVIDLQDQTKSNILIVEDNIVNQQLVMRMLERNGCQVDLAVNGFEAIELFKKNKYALIFMDCLMPEMDGYETTQIIREIERSKPERGRTPIVALTANAFEEEAEGCFQVGMDEFMTKPFKIAQLEMVLERHVN